jgi:hypothetical protein
VRSLASSVSRSGEEDEGDGNLDGHTRTAHGSAAAKTLNTLRTLALSGRLKRSPDDTGGNGVDADTVRCLLLSESAREGGNGSLGGAVVDHGGVAHVAGDGAAVDDHGSARHVVQGVLADGHHGEDVELEGVLHDLEVDVLVVHAHLLLGGCEKKS